MNRIPPSGMPLSGIQNTNDPQPSPAADGPSKTAESQHNSPALPLRTHTSSTAQRFNHLFKSGAASLKAQQSAQARLAAKSPTDSRDAHGWSSSDYEQSHVKYDQSGQVRFMKFASAATAASGFGDDRSNVAHTDYLKQTARLLCNRDVNDGRLDPSHLDRMITELRGNPASNLRGTQLSDMERVLLTLRDDNELPKILNSIGEDRW
jgi:hypothetical protein